MKQSTTIIIPAIGALYFALAQIWQLPKAEEVVGSLAAINTFLGMILGVSSRTYNRNFSSAGAPYVGAIQIDDDGKKKKISLVVNGNPELIETMDEATFKINNNTTGTTSIFEQ